MRSLPLWALLWTVSVCASDRPPDGANAVIDRVQLKGRLFLVAVDSSEPPTPGSPLPERLFMMPANGSRAPQRVADFMNASDLVTYPSKNRLGVNSRSGDSRGSFIVDISPGANYGVTQILDATKRGLFTVPGWTPNPSRETERHILPTQVVVSPDGSRLAGLDAGNHVCVAPINAQAATVCAANVLGCRANFPTWSPDGKAIAFAAPIAGNLTACNLYEVFVMDATTGSTRQLTNIPGERLTQEMRNAMVKSGDSTDRWQQTGNPVWSPDGRWIAFGSRQGVGKIHPDGSGLAIIVRGTHPAWSPDGAMIAFLAPRSEVSARAKRQSRLHVHFGVFIARADGTGAVEVDPNPDSSLTVMDVAWTE